MAKRILLAGVLGAIAMFVWATVSHMVLPLGEVGVQQIAISNEPAVLNAMQTGLGPKPGLYIFPGMGVPMDASRQEKRAAMQEYGKKLAALPSGLLIYHPPGRQALTGGQLGTEFLTEFVQALLLAIVLASLRSAGFGARVGVAILIGLMAAIATNVPYWNWYGFPSNYTAVYISTQVVNYLVAGIVAAALLKNVGRRASAMTA